MNIAFYTALSGMTAYQKDMDNISNNIANVSTAGFKQQQSTFQDLLYKQYNAGGNGQNMVLGNGVKNNGPSLIFTQGSMQQTDNPLDFAINGQGLFAVQDADGQTLYTKNGQFYISQEQEGLLLVNGEGNYVLDSFGNRIQIYFKEGTNVPEISDLVERIGVFSFPNLNGLIPVGSSLYAASDNSGLAYIYDGQYNIIQGAFEMSNVDLAKEMSNVIQTQKAFQFNSKIIKTADELEQISNNLR